MKRVPQTDGNLYPYVNIVRITICIVPTKLQDPMYVRVSICQSRNGMGIYMSLIYRKSI